MCVATLISKPKRDYASCAWGSTCETLPSPATPTLGSTSAAVGSGAPSVSS
ncbi:hypothetical protein [Enhygromyxa salina]|uniref:hypothetical protein n=1 Tax=Enhygromyxa salina TaxID=215803 RepID=UPI0015E7CBFF|nr:hypothetical protein [Enhygromyxa salina]